MTDSFPREVRPEILDSLPEDHPDALGNRRDLRTINALMGNVRWFRRVLPGRLREGEAGLELGPGDGILGARLRRSGRLPAAVRVDGLDFWKRPKIWPSSWQWHREDLLDFTGYDRYRFFLGNLIFHQFEDAQLAELGARLRRGARLIAACEPCRRTLHLRQFQLLKPLGMNRVSRHDGQVSIRAGFRDDELPRLLGLSPDTWEIRCSTTLLGAYRMLAVRRC